MRAAWLLGCLAAQAVVMVIFARWPPRVGIPGLFGAGIAVVAAVTVGTTGGVLVAAFGATTFAVLVLHEGGDLLMALLATWSGAALIGGLLMARLRRAEGDRERALNEERVAHGRLEVLHDLSTGLVGAMTESDVAAIVCRTVAGRLGAAGAALALVDNEGGSLEVRAVEGSPEGSLHAGQRIPIDADVPIARALRERSLLLIAVDEPKRHRLRHPPADPFSDRRSVFLPMMLGDQPVGSLACTFARAYPIDDAEVDSLRTVAAQAALALSRARAYEREREVAVKLQERLLPKSLPQIPGVLVAARYEAAGDLTRVGGDFYDVFEIDRGRWKAAIGDVCGKGADAAALMGFVRFTARAISREEIPPSLALEKLNLALLEEVREEGIFCSACLVRIHPNETGARLTIAVAGHPLPVLVHADGRSETVGVGAGVLGVFDELGATDTAVDLGLGDTLIMLTDGVLEASRDDAWQERTVPHLLATSAGMHPRTIADRIVAHTRRVRERDDDIAVLVLQAPAGLEAIDTRNVNVPGVLVADTGRRYVDASLPMLAMLGYRREELLGLRIDDLVGESERWRTADFARYANDGGWSGDVDLRRRDGTWVRGHADTVLLDTHGGPRYESVIRARP